MKLLHVDPDQAFVRGWQNELLRNGAILCELEIAENVTEAEKLLSRSAYDAVLIDPLSAHDDSFSALVNLHAAVPTTPLIVLTDKSDDHRAVEAVASGASDFLVKNQCQPEWLMRRVRYAIERAKCNMRQSSVRQPQLRSHRPNMVASVFGSSVPKISLPAHGLMSDERQPRRQPAGVGGDGHVFRLLHVEDDPAFQRLVAKLLESAGVLKFRIDRAESLRQATDRIHEDVFDLVLLDLSLPDSSGLDTLSTLLEMPEMPPIVVLTGRDDDATAIHGMRLGAEDYLTKTETNLRYCPRASQLAVTRRRRITLEELPGTGSDEAPAVEVRRSDATYHERREHSRYLLTKPIFAIPLLPDRAPAEAYCADGFTIDVSRGGLQFEVVGIQRLPTKQVLVGIEAQDGVLHFATLDVRRVEATEMGLRIGAEFATAERDLIQPENIEPQFNARTCRFELGLPDVTIGKWVEFGIFRPALIDRLLVCPQCRAVPTFRNGCRICGSVRLHSRPLIHHFACAHVGYVTDFEHDDSVVCPKCRTRNLIVGADYEHLQGPYRCLDCDWSDTELELVGQCLKCAFRFPMNQALEEDLVGYHVHRLDTLALIHGH